MSGKLPGFAPPVKARRLNATEDTAGSPAIYVKISR
jgi:hypothetical protein